MLDMDAKRLADQIDSMAEQLKAIASAVRSESASSFPSSLTEEAKAGVCHYCKKPLHDGKNNRGDHPKCYKEIYRAIAAGQVTEEIVISKGWIEPPRTAGRKPNMTPIKQLIDEMGAAKIADSQKKVAEQVDGYERPARRQKGDSKS